MRYICDFHVHSKYSRATSREMDVDNIAKWAKIKGVDIITPGDFTHPAYFKELQEKLEPLGNGLYRQKGGEEGPLFILTAEISCIYKKGGKCRRMHNVVFMPGLEEVKKFNSRLAKIGNIHSDGRPILGLDSKELLKIALDVSEEAFFVPAHVWTPWFALFGSKSGFDSIEECFEDLSSHIHALETGLSSDPPMNWRLSALDNLTLISNSDAHSPANLGREANVFELTEEISYEKIIETMRNRRGFEYTIEFFPEEGKYHYDGHRLCGVCLNPAETNKNRGICPVCKKPLVIGVMNRVSELADRDEGFSDSHFVPYKSIVPLQEIIARVMGRGKNTKGVKAEYDSLIEKGGSEFKILMDLSEKELEKITLSAIARGIINVRERKIRVSPGYDGVYGTIDFTEDIPRPQQGALEI